MYMCIRVCVHTWIHASMYVHAYPYRMPPCRSLGSTAVIEMQQSSTIATTIPLPDSVMGWTHARPTLGCSAVVML